MNMPRWSWQGPGSDARPWSPCLCRRTGPHMFRRAPGGHAIVYHEDMPPTLLQNTIEGRPHPQNVLPDPICTVSVPFKRSRSMGRILPGAVANPPPATGALCPVYHAEKPQRAPRPCPPHPRTGSSLQTSAPPDPLLPVLPGRTPGCRDPESRTPRLVPAQNPANRYLTSRNASQPCATKSMSNRLSSPLRP